MKTYIALLKGINVGGKNILKMQSLVKSLESLNFKNISTYIQSGNIIFQTNEESIPILQQLIHNIIKTDYDINIPVLIFTFSEWDSMIHKEIFEVKEDRLNATYLTFWNTNAVLANFSLLEAKKQTEETYLFSENCFYLHTSNGYSKTKLNQQYLEKILGTPTSTRNLKTCLKIYELAAKL